MELFKYRNIALGCACFLSFLFISYYMSGIARIVFLSIAAILAITLVLVCIICRTQALLSVSLRVIPSLLFIILAMAVSMIAFKDNERLYQYYDGQAHNATVKITDASYTSSYYCIYEAELFTVDGVSIDTNVILYLEGTPLERGDIVSLNGVFERILSPTVGFDSTTYNLGKGIEASISSNCYTVIENEPIILLDLFDKANDFLDARLQGIGDERAEGVLSALFLGNKERLDIDIKRDFKRIGLNHVMALSGMHITIVVTLIGYSLMGAPIQKIYKEIILVLATLAFIGITGFSLSALRAGLMVCLAYTLRFFGGRVSTISALFISVTLICISSPYSIFSVSLILSFFAMLGCIASSRIIKRYRLYRVFRHKISRFVAFAFISTVFAVLFTLPIVSLFFGSISLISPISNILIAPFLSLLIYLCPLYLITADIPVLSVAIGSICKWITRLSLYLGSALADIDGILIPLLSPIQNAGIVIITLCLFALLIVKRAHLKHALWGVGLGVLVFAVGTLLFFAQRWSNIYVGAYSEDGDIAFIEDKGEITVIDITDASSSKHVLAASVAEYLGYFEIDNYIITSYSKKSVVSFDNLSDSVIVRNVYLPEPKSQEEQQIRDSICAIAAEKSIDAFIMSGTVSTENTLVTFAPTSKVSHSTKKAIAFCVDYGTARFSYLGQSSFELCTPFVDEIAYTADVVVFGAHGPSFKTDYAYEMPYADLVIFFGDTISFADKAFVDALGGRAKEYHGYPIRFSLTP